MGIRRSQVARLIKAADQHDTAARQNGWRATPESDRLRNVYDAAVRNSTEEEVSMFRRVWRVGR